MGAGDLRRPLTLEVPQQDGAAVGLVESEDCVHHLPMGGRLLDNFVGGRQRLLPGRLTLSSVPTRFCSMELRDVLPHDRCEPGTQAPPCSRWAMEAREPHLLDHVIRAGIVEQELAGDMTHPVGVL